MQNPTVIDDKMIHSPTVGTNAVSNIRPTGPGWHLPVNSTHKPEVTVVLSNTPVNVQEITITGSVDVEKFACEFLQIVYNIFGHFVGKKFVIKFYSC